MRGEQTVFCCGGHRLDLSFHAVGRPMRIAGNTDGPGANCRRENRPTTKRAAPREHRHPARRLSQAHRPVVLGDGRAGGRVGVGDWAGAARRGSGAGIAVAQRPAQRPSEPRPGATGPRPAPEPRLAGTGPAEPARRHPRSPPPTRPPARPSPCQNPSGDLQHDLADVLRRFHQRSAPRPLRPAGTRG